jgi:hypothetical protein
MVFVSFECYGKGISSLSFAGTLMHPSMNLSLSTPPWTVDLYRRRIKHDADRGAEGFGRERLDELRTDDTRVAYK